MATPYVYEFLYRGRAPGASEPPAYHVILAQDADTFGKTVTTTSDPLTPDQAKAQGFDLTTIVKGIAASALAEASDLRTQLAAMTIERDGLIADISRLGTEASAAGEAATAEIAGLRAEVARLTPSTAQVDPTT